MNTDELDALFASESFRSLGEESQKLLREFAAFSQGKSQSEAMLAFMQYYKKLSATGITAAQQAALVNALKSSLSPESQQKLAVMEQMMQKMHKTRTP